jgi:hypothetical protein
MKRQSQLRARPKRFRRLRRTARVQRILPCLPLRPIGRKLEHERAGIGQRFSISPPPVSLSGILNARDQIARAGSGQLASPSGRAVPDFCWMWFPGNRLHSSNSDIVID